MGKVLLLCLLSITMICVDVSVASPPCEPELIAPNGGEVWHSNTSQTIVWTCVQGTVDIWLWNGDESTWVLLQQQVDATKGAYVFVPGFQQTGELFRVKLVFGAGDEITSSTYFAIRKENQSHPTTGSSLSPVIIQPNPASDLCQIRLENDAIVGYTLFTYDGVELVSQSFTNGLSACSLSVSSLQPGVYILRVRSEQNEYVGKLVVQR